MSAATDGGWTILGTSATYEGSGGIADRALPEEIAPALAFQYCVDLNLKLDLMNFIGIGALVTSWFHDERFTEWALTLRDLTTTEGGAEVDEFGLGGVGEGVEYRRVFQDSVSGLWTFDGLDWGMGGAYAFYWFYGSEALTIPWPQGALTSPADLLDRGNFPPEPNLQEPWGSILWRDPSDQATVVADYVWLLCSWVSPVYHAPIPASVGWEFRLETTFDENWWALRMRRAASFGGMADRDVDHILHRCRVG